MVGSASDRAFTLDDGTTTLVGNDVRADTFPGFAVLDIANGVGAFVAITFVGTGLDVIQYGNGSGSTAFDVDVDGTNTGNVSGIDGEQRLKVVSGLPYGTHVVELRATAVSLNIGFSKFIIYGPKKPTLSTGAIELSEYYIMADYDSSSVVTANPFLIPEGTIAKSITREFIYDEIAGAWSSPSLSVNRPLGWLAAGTNLQNDNSYELQFFGESIAIQHQYQSGIAAVNYVVDIEIDGVLDATGVVIAGNASNDTGGQYTFVIDTDATKHYMIEFTGLTLGKHSIKVTKQSGNGSISICGAYIQTPIHYPESKTPANIQNNLPIGSLALGDLRKFTAIKEESIDLPNWARAIGDENNPTTTSSSLIPIPDMAVVVKTDGNPIKIDWWITWKLTGIADAAFQIVVDGETFGSLSSSQNAVLAGSFNLHTFSRIVPVAAGTHHILIQWATGSGTMTAQTTKRELYVQEIK